jgi:hypothetical protein
MVQSKPRNSFVQRLWEISTINIEIMVQPNLKSLSQRLWENSTINMEIMVQSKPRNSLDQRLWENFMTNLVNMGEIYGSTKNPHARGSNGQTRGFYGPSFSVFFLAFLRFSFVDLVLPFGVHRCPFLTIHNISGRSNSYTIQTKSLLSSTVASH